MILVFLSKHRILHLFRTLRCVERTAHEESIQNFLPKLDQVRYLHFYCTPVLTFPSLSLFLSCSWKIPMQIPQNLQGWTLDRRYICLPR